MDVPSEFDRRRFLERAGAVGTALLLAGCAGSEGTPTSSRFCIHTRKSPRENVVLIREPYRRDHDVDVLAWKAPMERGVAARRGLPIPAA